MSCLAGSQVLLGVVRLLLARQHGDLPAVTQEAQQLQALAGAPEAAQPGLGEELRALALISLGITEHWAGRMEEAQRHLEQGVVVARRIGRPYLEFSGLAYQALGEIPRSFTRAAERSWQTIELARQHGWTDEVPAAHAYATLAAALAWQGRPEDAEAWLQRAERTIRADSEPTVALAVYHLRGVIELARGQEHPAIAAFRAVERLAGYLAEPHLLVPSAHAYLLHALGHLGETERAEQVLASLDDRDCGEMRVAAAGLWLARGDPSAATATLAPVLDGSVPLSWPTWLVHAFMREAIAQDALGDAGAAGRALERTLDLAEPDGGLLTFLLHPAPNLIERQLRQRTAHAALITQIVGLLAGRTPTRLPARSQPPLEPLSKSEIRVLRYLPTHLTAPEIASELSVSTTTIKTHLRNLYAKLGVHSRGEAVESARALGLLAPAAHQR